MNIIFGYRDGCGDKTRYSMSKQWIIYWMNWAIRNILKWKGYIYVCI
jgi:hypothetical protein